MKKKAAPQLRTLTDLREQGTGAGLVCPTCGCLQFSVHRTMPMQNTIVRYRKCRNCGRNIKTTES